MAAGLQYRTMFGPVRGGTLHYNSTSAVNLPHIAQGIKSPLYSRIIIIMGKTERLIEHSEQCAKLSERKCCINCYRERNKLRQANNRLKIKNALDDQTKTRSKTVPQTKYYYALCDNCKFKRHKEICENCIKDYECERKRVSKENIKKRRFVQIDSSKDSQVTKDILPKKFKYVHNSDQLQPNDNVSESKKEKDNCKQNNHKNLENCKKHSLVQTNSVNSQVNKLNNLEPKTKYAKHVCPKCKPKLPIDFCKSCKKIYEKVKKRASRENIKKRSLVQTDVVDSNDTEYQKDYRENIKNHNANINKNEISYKLSDLENVSPCKQKLSIKTKRNNTSLMKKIAGSSPNTQREKYTHLLQNAKPKVRKGVLKDLLPEFEDEVKGKVCQEAKKFLGTKTNASYALQSHFINNSESNETKVIKNYRLNRKKVKQMRTHKVNSRKPREKK